MRSRSASTTTLALVSSSTTTRMSGVGPGELSSTTIDLLDGSSLEVVGPSELQLTGYFFTIEVPAIGSSNVDLAPGVNAADPAAVDQAAILESDLGSGVRLWRADRVGQPFFMTVDLGGWVAFLHVANETAPDAEFLLSLSEDLRGEVTENGVVLSDLDLDFFTAYLGSPTTENLIHLAVNQCVRERVPGAEAVDDRTRGALVRKPTYASWCQEDANLEVLVYGHEQFVALVVGEMTLSREKPPGLSSG